MDYSESLAYLKEVELKYGISPGLDNVTSLFKAVGNPWDNLKIIHIAGTNGKGSTGTFISYVLSEMGFKVGRYISPTVDGYREKIQYICAKESEQSVYTSYEVKSADGPEYTKTHVVTYISEEEVSKYMTRLKPYCELIGPTVFEIETVMAFLAFADWKCDYVVLECGMGGLLDATNCIPQKEMCVFTSISEEHKSYLGKNVREITKNKAGILRRKVKAVSAGQMNEVKTVLEKCAEEYGAELSFAETPELIKAGVYGSAFLYDGEKYNISLPGSYQIENAAAAIEAIYRLFGDESKKTKNSFLSAAVKSGLKKAIWKNRFQIICKKPYVVIDGAHNPDAAQKLKESVDTVFPKGQFCRIGIMGVFSDKDVKAVLSNIKDTFDELYTVKAPGARGMEALELARLADEHMKMKCISLDGMSAYEAAKMLCDNMDNDEREKTAIIIFGSLSLCAPN